MNEHDVVLFHNYNILVVDSDRQDALSDVSDDDVYDPLEPIEDDIFSNDHPWDTRVNSYRLRHELWFSEQEIAFFLSDLDT
jgi:hypothetical protein